MGTNTISAENHQQIAEQLGSVVSGPVERKGLGLVGASASHGNGHGHRGPGKPSMGVAHGQFRSKR